MSIKGMTKLDATRKWVGEFNAIPQEMIARLMKQNPDEWEEVTLPSVDDKVYIYDVPEGCSNGGQIRSYDIESDIYFVEPDEGDTLTVERGDFELCRYDSLPMWGTMWSFGTIDDWWLEEDGGLRKMSDCGFRIYHHDEWGYFFGIDAAGFDFWEAFWLPLYNARGLQWHEEKAEDEVGDE